ncbi:uncharacterized protein TRIVIDRAFT_68807 [Trichoderma virens Gv29-8]|uniref:C2H2-type domain-containing protein n=1 Tax=Hypocrea virens (strain Gv29-8 / FGSC 10586) TaxID=413071 RepID=G9MZ80_HYPVG|nr:uncharacterized protein TRIVIDRAFT_68807 [Trichoderma virens Gv29-8]EHK20406.1 hypothetical protein TRIVIDRAFT_68807 [Trichoderma virens Gv29-8]UKZ47064.1 hypothetical protein TrVGV298_001278 [Trichoderma virens]
MENKKVDDPGALALRRLVRSPTGGRLAPRRSSTVASCSSSSSSSSSASSVTSSVDGEMPTSCVSRNTSSDECALYRFIVWAAVKRNACQKMTSEERRECPLLRCRKRFPNHELMLQHLYSCDHLAGGEYWCYDCEKPEQLSDVKCRRCLGHPSKRRKIMTMAKSFFSSLGHKPKSHSLALVASMGMGLGAGDGGGSGGEDEPPSYDSVLFTPPPPQQAELFSTEIHEIGSSEVLLPTIPECETETEPIPAPGMIPCLPPSTFPISPPGSHPGTVPLPSMDEQFMVHNWRPSPPSPQTVAPQSLMKPSTARLVDRPTLQVNTHLDQYRGQGRRRSKVLAPSSSVRSTSSTDSTDSTDSTASYNISPMSGWSNGWTKTSGFESALTSPDDLISPQSLLPAGPFSSTTTTTNTADGTTSTRPIPFSNLEFENMVANSCPSELPADIPMFDDLSNTMDPQKTQASMGLDQAAFSFNADIPFQLPLAPQMPSTNSVDLSLAPPPPPPPPAQQQTTSNIESSLMRDANSSRLTTTTQSLARSVQDALRMHVAESRSKLDTINENSLLMQLNQMPLSSVAAIGLETMTDILEGRQASSPLNLVCFLHVVFSLSLVIHEQDASKHSAALFKQALLYSDWFSDDDKIPFIEVVYTLWKPSQVNDDEIIALLKSRPPIPSASMSKGKQPERFPQGLRSDPLILIAAYFLDELEYMAISESSYTGHASELAMQHHKDGLGASHNSPFAIAARFMIDNIFSHQYSHVPGFELRMEKLIDQINSSEVGTVRRLELELMQAGRTYLPPDAFFDEYVEVVRRQTDSLYTQSPYFSSRSTYHRCGIQLLMRESNRNPVIVEAGVESSGPSSGSLAGIVGVVSDGFDGFDFDSMVDLNPDNGLDVNIADSAAIAGAPLREAAEWTPGDSAYVTAPGSAAIATTPAVPRALDADALPLVEDDALISPIGSTPNKAEASVSSTKVESDSCCKICGYRPKGDPRWFVGSMAKHMRTIHSENPQIFRCPYPGCTSQYSKRADNLRQHQIEKNHFVDDEEKQGRRPRKRKRPSDGGGES